MEKQVLEYIKSKVYKLPTTSGVYKMLDIDGNIIYIGKAKNLKRRVGSYFLNTVKQAKVQQMVNMVADFDYILTNSELEALNLESNLIHKVQPFYNILLKDGKAFPYIKINTKVDFPKVEVTRKVRKDGALYFGPYFNKVNVNNLMLLISNTFKLRECNLNLVAGKCKSRECLNYHIGKCLAPCTGRVSKLEYDKEVKRLIAFLKGDSNEVREILKQRMKAYSDDLNFEKAIEMKECLKIVNEMDSLIITDLGKVLDLDVFGYASNGINSAIAVLCIRAGKMIGVNTYNVVDASLEESDTISNFISQYYLNSKIPKEVVANIEDENLNAWLSEQAKENIQLLCPKKSVKLKLLKMAEDNAQEHLYKSVEKEKLYEEKTMGAMRILKDTLGLKRLPKRIEGYDISNLGGRNIVASMVVFENGMPLKSHYRKFKVDLAIQNDFESMRQVLTRRMGELNKGDVSFSKMPDLILIDGGKGQLSFANSVLEKQNIDVDIISLAKREEEIYLPKISEPVVLSRSNVALKLLQNVRDESHRFAITFQRKVRTKKDYVSELDNIEMLGKEKAKALIKYFKSVTAIKSASVQELKMVEGIGDTLANNIFKYFHKDK